jgi:hypothetical protein
MPHLSQDTLVSNCECSTVQHSKVQAGELGPSQPGAASGLAS